MTKTIALWLTLAVAFSAPALADQTVEAPAAVLNDPTIHKDFVRLDSNGDGAVTFAEFAEKRWPDRLNYFDADHNGRISLVEYQTGTCINEGQDTAENRQIIADCHAGVAQDAKGATEWTSGDGFPDLVFAYHLLDCDKDGRVTPQEYASGRTSRCTA